jgi:hypothetical protein
MKRLALELRRTFGRALLLAGERVLREPCFVDELRGDSLTRAARQWGVYRELDGEIRRRVKVMVGVHDSVQARKARS